jgi:aminoglycoside phosphotransferase (APT) family kinase protein
VIAHTDTIEMAAVLAQEHAQLADLLGRPGTRVVMLAGSRDPNAKVTMILFDDYGPSFIVKIPTTREAARVVRNEGDMLEALAAMRTGRLSVTIPQPVGYLSAQGLPALVATTVDGVPMTVAYHAWRHTARRRTVSADFAAAGAWLAELQTRTAKQPAPVTLLSDALDAVSARFPDHPDLAMLRRRLTNGARRLADQRTPRTVVHGDYWFGNLLLTRGQVVGVVDWESGEPAGEPLRDVARFAVSYALYLDRHVRPNGRVPGHRGMRADAWGTGLAYVLQGRGWFSRVVRGYLVEALERLGVSSGLWPEVLFAGVVDAAATADHPEFAAAHLSLLARVLYGPELPIRSPSDSMTPLMRVVTGGVPLPAVPPEQLIGPLETEVRAWR